MKKINKAIGYSLSIISIITGVLIFGVGIYHFFNWVSGGFFYLLIGVFLLVVGFTNISDIKEKKI